MKMTLDNRAVTDNFFDDTRLLGIMAPMKDYLFCRQVVGSAYSKTGK